MDEDTWDCIVVGGGAAGLSAALVLGRARRRTLLVDAGRPSNAVAHGIGGLVGQDGRPPGAFYAAGRAELTAYPTVSVIAGEVVDAEGAQDAFVVTLADGVRHQTRRILLAPGMDYRHPDLPGLAERWGGAVFHCPFCHGWEVRDRALCVLGDGASAVHRATMLTLWSADVTVLTDGPGGLSAEEASQLERAGVGIDERPIVGVRGPGVALEAVVFADGGERPCGGLMVPVVLHQRSGLARRLGLETTTNAMVEEAIVVEAGGTTSVPGVHAAGDATPLMPSVANAISSGSTAASVLVGSLAPGAPAAPPQPDGRRMPSSATARIGSR